MIQLDPQTFDIVITDDPGWPGGKAKDSPNSESVEGTKWPAKLMNNFMGFFYAAIVEAVGSFQVTGEPDRVGASEILDALKTIMQVKVDGASDTWEEALAAAVNAIGVAIQAEITARAAGDTNTLNTAKAYADTEVAEALEAANNHSDANDETTLASAKDYTDSLLLRSHPGQAVGPETIIPLSVFGFEFNSEKYYAVFISLRHNDQGYLPFIGEVRSDGLHVFSYRLKNGAGVPGTAMKKWGTGKWDGGVSYLRRLQWGIGKWTTEHKWSGELLLNATGVKWNEKKWGNGTWGVRFIKAATWGAYAPVDINILIQEV
jgi:hypothetical protein